MALGEASAGKIGRPNRGKKRWLGVFSRHHQLPRPQNKGSLRASEHKSTTWISCPWREKAAYGVLNGDREAGCQSMRLMG